MRTARIFPILMSALAVGVTTGAVIACGTGRCVVNVCDNSDAASIGLKEPVSTTIESQDALAATADRAGGARAGLTEHIVFRLKASISAYKLETDGDYHPALDVAFL